MILIYVISLSVFAFFIIMLVLSNLNKTWTNFLILYFNIYIKFLTIQMKQYVAATKLHKVTYFGDDSGAYDENLISQETTWQIWNQK